jgi:lysine N6-hydroxylase
MLTCVGVGAGPANLSLACQLSTANVAAEFLDRKALCNWHEGMQIEGTQLQVSIFKDLVTLADPTSPYSFVAYLHNTGRLYHFLNAQFVTVSRREFGDYLAWVSDRLSSVIYGETVEEIDFDGAFTITTDKRVLRSRNVSVAVGKAPNVPAFAETKLCDTLFHSSEFTFKNRALGGRRVMIVGGGQSGAEVFLDCISRKGADAPAHVHWVSSRSNFLPIDDSPFTNDLFMPCQVAHFERHDLDGRAAYIRENLLASDGISLSTLQAIYQKLYEKRFLQSLDDFATLAPSRRVTMLNPATQGWLARLHHKAGWGDETVQADTVILATGYRNPPTPFLDRLSHRFHTVSGEIRVDRDFAVEWDGPRDRSIFIQNATRGQKGLADPNLSLVAWRARMILARIQGDPRLADAVEPSFVAWTSDPAEFDLREYA